MFVALVVTLCAASILLCTVLPAWLAFDVLVWEPVTTWYRTKCEERLAAKEADSILCLPYVSWSDTVTMVPRKES